MLFLLLFPHLPLIFAKAANAFHSDDMWESLPDAEYDSDNQKKLSAALLPLLIPAMPAFFIFSKGSDQLKLQTFKIENAVDIIFNNNRVHIRQSFIPAIEGQSLLTSKYEAGIILYDWFKSRLSLSGIYGQLFFLRTQVHPWGDGQFYLFSTQSGQNFHHLRFSLYRPFLSLLSTECCTI
jgi:hypothetical protein